MAVYYKKLMLILNFCVGIIVFFCMGCSEIKKTERAEKEVPVLKQYIQLHTFSDPIKLDTFKLTVIGSSVMQSKTTLEIISYEGKPLYTDTFGTKLLVNEPINMGIESDSSTAEDERKFIKSELKFLFYENFRQPAIGENESFDKDSSTEYWHEIKANKKAINFVYPSVNRSLKNIAYSKKLKKAVVYSIVVFRPPIKDNK